MMSIPFSRTVQTLVCLVCLLVTWSLSTAAAQQVPEVITYQGTLADAEGNPITDPVDLTFRFYDSESDGAQLPGGEVWSESYTGVPVTTGRFSVLLGSQTPLPNVLFDNRQQLWLEVEVNGETLPRTRMTSTAFAREAQSVVDGAIGTGALANGVAVRGVDVLDSDGASLDVLTDDVSIQEGNNVTLETTDGVLTISAVGADGGLSSVAVAAPLTGDGTSSNPVGVADGGISTAQLADDSVTDAKLADGTSVRSLTAKTNSGATVTTQTDAVTVRAGDNVTIGEQDGEITISAVGPDGGLSSVSSDQTLVGNGTADQPLGVANNSITSARILDGQVQSSDLATDAVSTAKILDDAVTASKIDDAAAVKSLNSFVGSVTVTSSDNTVGITSADGEIDLSLSSDAAVTQLNNLTGGLSLIGGANVSITDNGADQITISSTDTGITSVASDATLAGDGTTESELGIAENGVGRTELASDVVVDQLNGLTGGVTIATAGGASISTDESSNTITINAGSGGGGSEIESISNTDGALDVTNSAGSVTINVADGGISTADLADNAVTGGVIQDGSIQGADLADAAVGPVQLGNDAVTAAKLADGSVSTAALQNSAVTSAQIDDGSVTSADLATESVGSAEVQNGAISQSDLATDAAVLGLALPSANTLRGTVALTEGTNVSITDNGTDQITISATSTGLTSVATDANKITGDGTAGGELSLAESAVTGFELANDAVGSDALAPNTAVTLLEIQNNGGATTGPFRDAITLNGGSNVTLSEASGAITIDATDTGLLSVATDGSTIAGDGTSSANAVRLANGGVTAAKLSPAVPSTSGQVLGYDGTSLVWTSGASGDITAVETPGGSGLTGGAPSGSVSLSIANGGVTGSRIADTAIQGSGAITVDNSSGNFVVSTSALTSAVTSITADGTTLTDDITLQGSDDISITSPSSGVFEIDFTGSTSTGVTSITSGSGITTDQATGDVTVSITDDGVNTAQIAPNAVTVTELAAEAVTSSEVADGSVAPVDVDGSGGTSGQALITDGTAVSWGNPSAVVATDGTTLTGDGTSGAPLAVNEIGSAEIADGSVSAGDLSTEAAIQSISDGTNTVTGTGTVAFDGINGITITADNTANTVTFDGSSLGGLTSVSSDATLNGDGTSDSPLGLAAGAVGSDEIADGVAVRSLNGQTEAIDLTSSNGTVAIDASTAGVIDLSASTTSSVTTDGTTMTGDGTAGNELSVGSIGSGQITDGSVTSADISDGTVAPADMSSATATTADQALMFDGTNVVWGNPSANVTSDGTTIIGDGTSTNALSIPAGGVGETQIATGAVGSDEVALNALTADDLASASVTTDEIEDGAVANVDLADGAVSAASLSAGSPTDNFVLTYDSGEADSLRWGDPAVLASSIRWKENVRTLDDALSLVEELRGVRYDWTESGAADVGVIAEEVAAVLPELVDFEDDGQARGVHYAKLVAVLIEATKAQQTELETKDQTIARQQDEIDAMKQRMDRLERLVEQVAAEDGQQ